MIKVNNLYKDYGDGPVVRGINMEIMSGEIFGLLGPNGAGKSTTIKMMTGQLQPTAGTVQTLGYNLPEQRRLITAEMGVAPENANLYERLSVYDNLALFCRLYGVSTGSIKALLAQVGLPDAAKKQVKQLSKGMRQKVLLVRAILHNPHLLFLDEPTSGLDPSSTADIHALLKEINSRGTTIFLTTHNMAEADDLCNRVAFLSEGQIAEEGNPEELKRKYGEERLEVVLQAGGTTQKHMLELSGAETGRMVGAWLSEGKVVSIHSIDSSLADIFIKVTGRKLA